MKRQRPFGLVLIVSYKAVLASILAVTSLSLGLALNYANFLQSFAESYLLEGKLAIVEMFVTHAGAYFTNTDHRDAVSNR